MKSRSYTHWLLLLFFSCCVNAKLPSEYTITLQDNVFQQEYVATQQSGSTDAILQASSALSEFTPAASHLHLLTQEALAYLLQSPSISLGLSIDNPVQVQLESTTAIWLTQSLLDGAFADNFTSGSLVVIPEWLPISTHVFEADNVYVLEDNEIIINLHIIDTGEDGDSTPIITVLFHQEPERAGHSFLAIYNGTYDNLQELEEHQLLATIPFYNTVTKDSGLAFIETRLHDLHLPDSNNQDSSLPPETSPLSSGELKLTESGSHSNSHLSGESINTATKLFLLSTLVYLDTAVWFLNTFLVPKASYLNTKALLI